MELCISKIINQIEFENIVLKQLGTDYEILSKYQGQTKPVLVRHLKCGREYHLLANKLTAGVDCAYCARRRFDTDSFAESIKKLVGNEYSVIGEYVKSSKPIKIRHNVCKNEYSIVPSEFKRGKQCPYCSSNHRKTTAEFEEQVFNKFGDEYQVIGQYVNSKTKIKIRHNSCGNEILIAPKTILQGKGCKICTLKNKTKTTQKYKNEVAKIVGNEYTVTGEYINASTKIPMQHNVCGNTFLVSPNHFLSRKSRCPYCAGNIKMTPEMFSERVSSSTDNEYEVQGQYVDYTTKVLLIHHKCNNTYMVTPKQFIFGNRCPYCARTHKKSQGQFEQEVKDLVGNEFVVIGTYVNDSTKIEFRHNKCSQVISMNPNSFLQGSRCGFCAKNKKKNLDDFKRNVFEQVDDEYTVIGKYVNSATKIAIKHNDCKTVYQVTPNSFLSGNRCPNCSDTQNSHGIRAILKTLDKNDIAYKREMPIHTEEHRLRFDVYIDGINTAIEFDGHQHFKPVDLFGGEEGFKKRQYLDNLKNKYCQEYDIKLLRIPYTKEKEIPEILAPIVKEYNSIRSLL